MATALKDKMKNLPAARRKKIEARAAELIAQQMTLRELRQATGAPRSALPKHSASDRKAYPGSKSAATS